MKIIEAYENERDINIYVATVGFLREIGVTARDGGRYIIEAVAILAKEANQQFSATKLYEALGEKFGKGVSTINNIISNSVARIWESENQNQDVLKRLFPDYKRMSTERPANLQFFRTLTDYLTASEVYIINAGSFAKILSGYMLMSLKEWGLSDKDLIEILQDVDRKTRNHNLNEAERAYKEFEDKITPVTIDGMVVPRRCENINISKLDYSEKRIGAEIVNKLNIENVFCIKDFQKYDIDNLRKVRILDEEYISEFDNALMRTIIRGD